MAGARATHSRSPSIVNINNNTSWLSAPGVWTAYVAVLLSVWLGLCALAPPRTAGQLLVLLHFAITFPLFHWHKGSPIAADQGEYDKLTFWEQMDEGVQLTRNKKFFTALPVLLFIPCWQGGVHAGALELAALVATVVLIVAKLPLMDRVRIFGINED